MIGVFGGIKLNNTRWYHHVLTQYLLKLIQTIFLGSTHRMVSCQNVEGQQNFDFRGRVR